MAATSASIQATGTVRRDASLKAAGTARYAADFPHAGTAYAALVRSTCARGAISSIDTTAAEAVAGVELILTIAASIAAWERKHSP